MTKFFCKAGYKKASICFFDFLSNTSPDNALRIKLSISSVLCSFLMMKMYVTHSKNSVPQIDFSTWKQQEAERAEAESLERLRCRYLKSTDNRAPDPAKENLTLFYEKVFNGYTSKLQINPSVPDAMQSALHRGLLAFNLTAAKTLAEAADSDESAMDKAGENLVYSANRLSNILRLTERSFCDFIALSSYARYSKYLFVSERTDNFCMRCESLHGQMFTLNELAEKNVIPPLHPNCKCRLFAMDAKAEYVYNLNRDGSICQLDRYCSEALLEDGGVYLLSRDTLGGKGGGVQYKILGELDDSMFVDARPVQ